jgi:antirestriction protein
MEDQTEPRVYAASLTDYVNGRLHGEWIDISPNVEDMQAQISAMLAASPTTAKTGEPAEEWAIHDFEGFGSHRIHEHDSLETLAAMATASEELGEDFEAYLIWLDHAGMEPSDARCLEQFQDAYQGEWETLERYADNLIEETWASELERAGLEHIAPYIDTELFARDLGFDGYFERDGHVFAPV